MSRNPIARNLNTWSRKLHRLGAIVFALPAALVLSTGLLLQVKKQVPAIQPETRQGTGSVPRVSLEAVLAAAATVPEADIESWDDVVRVDIQPRIAVAKVIGRSRWEVQVDLADGRVLQSAIRRSDLIESLHDGSFFGDAVKLGLFLPAGLALFGLWMTGIYLWVLPILARRRRDQRAKQEFGASR